MKYIFFGTPEFAAIILEKLIKAGFVLEAIICNPDKPVGRKKIITPPATKILAEKYNIEILQPEILANCKLQITNYKPDLFIVAAYAKIIPKEILEIPRLGTIGVHPSLLPKYRGATPIQSVILNNDKETGTTLYLMDEKMDHGPIIRNEKLKMRNEDDYETLMRKLAELSANLLIEILSDIENKIEPPTEAKPRTISPNGEIGVWVKNAKPQNEIEATYTKKFLTEDAFIKPDDLKKAQTESNEIALQIERKIRALNPEPGIFTIINKKRTKLLEAKIIDEKLKLTKIQIEGKKPIILS